MLVWFGSESWHRARQRFELRVFMLAARPPREELSVFVSGLKLAVSDIHKHPASTRVISTQARHVEPYRHSFKAGMIIICT